MSVDKKKENLAKAVKALELSLGAPITEARDISGIIKDFEIAYELSWKLLKRNLEENDLQTYGPKDVIKKAYQNNYIEYEQDWLAMAKDRNLTTHTYNEAFAREMIERIKKNYLKCFNGLIA